MSKFKKTTVKENLLTFNDFESDIFAGFSSDKERIKYMSKAYKNLDLASAFSKFYNITFEQSVLRDSSINKVYTLTIGEV